MSDNEAGPRLTLASINDRPRPPCPYRGKENRADYELGFQHGLNGDDQPGIDNWHWRRQQAYFAGLEDGFMFEPMPSRPLRR
jgi:hypothetical protein